MLNEPDEPTWCARIKADYLLHNLPTGQIAHLGDAFPWTVTQEDIRLAEQHLSAAHHRALEIGFELASLEAT